MSARAALVLMVLLVASPAVAVDDKTSPGNRCGGGNGNLCSGNEGNDGGQGKANTSMETVVSGPAPTINIPRPAIVDRGVFVSQVGDANRISVRQAPDRAVAIVNQRGDRNNGAIVQNGGAIAYVDLRQTGALNDAQLTQDGLAGGNTLYVRQTGTANSAVSIQSAASGENGAVLTQTGDGNILTLTQSGRDNAALLTQNGNGNAMTADQRGDSNRLAWTQNGDNLSNLQIAQSGNGSLQITQSKQ